MKRLNEDYYKKTNEDEKRFLKEEERILWKGIPKKNSFIMQDTVKMAPIAILWLCIDLFIIFTICENTQDISVFFFIVPFFALHLMPVWIWIGMLIRSSRKIKTRRYYITDLRLLEVNIRDGNIVSEMRLSDVIATNISRSFADVLFHTADIKINGKENNLVFYDMVKPEEIIKKIQINKEEFVETKLTCPYCDSSLDNEFIKFCPYCGANLN